MIFFELTTDSFKDRFDRVGGGPEATRAGAPSARRPLRGLEVKEDTFAMLKVIDLLGREIKLYNSSYPTGKASSTTNFILQSVVEPRNEKFQIVETFGEPYIFLYGEGPRFLTCNSILIDSLDFNWQAEFWANYDKYLRGSKCAENGARVYLFYNDNIVEGYMVKAQAVNESMNPMAVQMQFDLFVTNYRNISMIGDPRFPIRLGVTAYIGPGSGLRKTRTTGELSNRGTILRSDISDNLDEWTSTPPDFSEEEDNTEEVDDLIQAAVAEAAANAANMNNVDSIADSALDKANKGTGGGSSPPAKPGTLSCKEQQKKKLVREATCPPSPAQSIPIIPPPTHYRSEAESPEPPPEPTTPSKDTGSTAANSSTVTPPCLYTPNGECL